MKFAWPAQAQAVERVGACLRLFWVAGESCSFGEDIDPQHQRR